MSLRAQSIQGAHTETPGRVVMCRIAWVVCPNEALSAICETSLPARRFPMNQRNKSHRRIRDNRGTPPQPWIANHLLQANAFTLQYVGSPLRIHRVFALSVSSIACNRPTTRQASTDALPSTRHSLSTAITKRLHDRAHDLAKEKKPVKYSRKKVTSYKRSGLLSLVPASATGCTRGLA